MATNEIEMPKLDETAVAKASARGRRLLARGPLATEARHEAGRIHVELSKGRAFEFPVGHAQGLSGAKVTGLTTIEISAAGLGLYWPRLDADLYVSALVKGVLGTRQWMAKIGAVGGQAATSAKASAAGANGKLGGRPRKSGPLKTN
jgi:hypothetical protein